MTVKHQEPGVGREGEVIPLVWSAELETICRLEMSKTTNFNTLSIKTFHMTCIIIHVYIHIYIYVCMYMYYGWWLLSSFGTAWLKLVQHF